MSASEARPASGSSGASVCVFCGSNTGSRPAFAMAAAALGRELAHRRVRLVYGGGRVGLMGVLADAALAGGGEVVGVIPGHLVDREIAHESLTRIEVTTSMHERKARMAELASGVIVLPGGLGTLDETFELLTWNQIGLIATPVVFLDVDGFFAPMLDLLDRLVDAGFLRPSHRAIAQLARDAPTAVEFALAPAPISTDVHKWLDLDRT